MADKQTVEAEMGQILYSLAKKANKTGVMFRDIMIGKEMWVEAFNEAEAQLNQLLIKERIDELVKFVEDMNSIRVDDGSIPIEYTYIRKRIANLENQLGEKS